MQQPPSDRSNKNPYAMPSAWPRAPQQTFHLRVPKPPAGAQAPKPAPPPRPARQSSILTGSALPVGYTAPQPAPEAEPFEVEPVAAPAPEPEAEAVAPAPEPEVAPAPPFIAPPSAPFAAPRRAKRRRENRAPLFIGAGLAAAAGVAAAAWLLLREPEATVEYATVAPPPAPAVREPVITPPALIGIAPESVAEEPVLRGAAEPVETAAVRQPVTRTTPSAPAAALPSGPQPYAGDVRPAAPTVAVRPLVIPPLPAPPPPASAPGPQTPVADPDAPQTTRDPTSGD